jgi:hypothetical protein
MQHVRQLVLDRTQQEALKLAMECATIMTQYEGSENDPADAPAWQCAAGLHVARLINQ